MGCLSSKQTGDKDKKKPKDKEKPKKAAPLQASATDNTADSSSATVEAGQQQRRKRAARAVTPTTRQPQQASSNAGGSSLRVSPMQTSLNPLMPPHSDNDVAVDSDHGDDDQRQRNGNLSRRGDPPLEAAAQEGSVSPRHSPPPFRSMSPSRLSPSGRLSPGKLHITLRGSSSTTRDEDLLQLVLEAEAPRSQRREATEDEESLNTSPLRRERTQRIRTKDEHEGTVPGDEDGDDDAAAEQQPAVKLDELSRSSFSSGRGSSRSRNSSIASSLMRLHEYHPTSLQSHDSRNTLRTMSSSSMSSRQRSLAFRVASGSSLGSSASSRALRSPGVARLVATTTLPRTTSGTPSLPPSVHTSMFSPAGSEISSASFFIGPLANSVGAREPSPEKQFMHVVELEDNRAQLWAQLGVDVLAIQQANEDVDVVSILSQASFEHMGLALPSVGALATNSHRNSSSRTPSTASLGNIARR